MRANIQTDCQRCSGSGAIRCPKCHGEGSYFSGGWQWPCTCGNCGGHGQTECPGCRGDGFCIEGIWVPDSPEETLEAIADAEELLRKGDSIVMAVAALRKAHNYVRGQRRKRLFPETAVARFAALELAVA